MKLGKHPARIDKRTLKLVQFLRETAPAAPESMDWFSAISSWGMMRNDELGCCTCAALGHALQAWSAATGSEYTVHDEVVVDAYSRWCGYIPGDESSDQGGVELDVLNQFRRDGLGGKQLLAYADINLGDQANLIAHVTQAIYLFGGLYIGLSLPITAQEQSTWDVVLNSNDNQAGSWGGHAVQVLGYDAKTVTCVTWGALKQMTWSFFGTYCDEAHALLMGEWATFAAKDFKLGTLQAELQAVTA